jgi:hypothetical protein
MGLLIRAHFFCFDRKGRPVVSPTNRPFQSRGSWRDPLQNVDMINSVAVKLKKIFEKGRDYQACRASCVWGHGFVAACFDGFAICLMLRRYRWPECHCAIRMKPQGYFARFQASIETIRARNLRDNTQKIITLKLSRTGPSGVVCRPAAPPAVRRSDSRCRSAGVLEFWSTEKDIRPNLKCYKKIALSP